jgi:hypothetical protein
VQPLHRGLASSHGSSLFPDPHGLEKDSLWNRNDADESLLWRRIPALSLPSLRPRTRPEEMVVVTERRKTMYYGRGFGRGFGMGYGRGMGYGGGMGFGFRGASPPWPYVGIGRGGLPRCWAYGGYGGPAYGYGSAPGPVPYVPPAYGGGPYGAPAPGWGPYGAPSSTEEVRFLKEEADMIRDALEAIDSRIKELEKEKTQGGES